ncbi:MULTISPECIES: hypothetical protein [unclassified Streptomyces]|uniref:hypothetical protein n=1 Tax=unclassified Streptomyces TaxID=2593676 RepID=UPI002888943F|nr:hypothetical protein [Streptomyces sp. DSM 41633]
MEHEQTIPEQPKGEESAPEPDTSPPRRRTGRTTLLIAGAAVLGVLAGTITGYAVQYHREPTPLPPLAQQNIAAPKPLAVNDATSTRSINANRWHKADEDLVAKLLEAPAGATVAFSGAQSTDAFAADFYANPPAGIGSVIRQNVRRIATVRWSEDHTNFVEIRLLQFQNRDGAERFQSGVQGYMPTTKHAGNAGVEVPGVPADFGHLWINSEASEKPGYLPVRRGTAVVRRGDIVMHIAYVNNRGEVDEKVVADLAKRQMERL